MYVSVPISANAGSIHAIMPMIVIAVVFTVLPIVGALLRSSVVVFSYSPSTAGSVVGLSDLFSAS